MNITRFFSAASLLILAMFSVTASGSGEHEYVIEKVFDPLVPIYMDGHIGQPQWIEGFRFDGDIYFNGSIIGTVSGVARLWNPPMNLAEAYDQLTLRITNTFPNVGGVGGSFQVYAQGVVIGNSSHDGGYILSWAGTVANGTDYFTGYVGTSAGSGVSVLSPPPGEPGATATEIITLRSSF